MISAGNADVFPVWQILLPLKIPSKMKDKFFINNKKVNTISTYVIAFQKKGNPFKYKILAEGQYLDADL